MYQWVIVATVPTVYGIETRPEEIENDLHIRKLQQYLPFTVLKLSNCYTATGYVRFRLQQYLPFTVLKLFDMDSDPYFNEVATVPTVYGIETSGICNLLQPY